MSTHKGIFKNSEIETLSSRVKFIGKLQPGQKICVSNQSIQENTYLTSFSRSLTGENREKVYTYISDTIQDSLDVLNSLVNTNNEYDVRVCRNLIMDMISMEPGLNNQETTYKNDKMFVSKIQTLRENLEVKLRELCNKRDDLDYEDLHRLVLDRIAAEESATSEDVTVQLDAPTEDEAEAEPEETVEEVNDEEEEKKKVEQTDELVEKVPVEEPEEEAEDESPDPEPVPEIEPEPEEEAEEPEDDGKVYVDVRDQPTARRTPPRDYLVVTESRPSLHQNNRASKKKRKKHAYQYDSYYMSSPDDITLCSSELEKGLINNK